jgi:chromate transporter
MKNRNIKTLLDVFLSFLKIGAFTFGGGYAMIPLIQKETVEKHGWISDKDILEIVAIAESTPGPIAINAATFVGYRVCGFWGAFFATFGVVLPAFLIIVAISYVLKAFEQLKAVKYAFFGIRAGVLALILKALWSLYGQCPKNSAAYLIAASAFILVAVLNVNVIFVIAGCAAAGLIASFIASRRHGQ